MSEGAAARAESAMTDFDAPPMLLVEWVDSYMTHGWGDRKDRLAMDRGAGHCKSVGFVVEDTDEWLTLAESVSASDNVGCTTTIPKFAIKKRVALPQIATGEKETISAPDAAGPHDTLQEQIDKLRGDLDYHSKTGPYGAT